MSKSMISKIIELDPEKSYIFTAPNSTPEEIESDRRALEHVFPGINIVVYPGDLEVISKKAAISKLVEIEDGKQYILTIPNATMREMDTTQAILNETFPNTTIVVTSTDIEITPETVEKPHISKMPTFEEVRAFVETLQARAAAQDSWDMMGMRIHAVNKIFDWIDPNRYFHLAEDTIEQISQAVKDGQNDN